MRAKPFLHDRSVAQNMFVAIARSIDGCAIDRWLAVRTIDLRIAQIERSRTTRRLRDDRDSGGLWGMQQVDANLQRSFSFNKWDEELKYNYS